MNRAQKIILIIGGLVMICLLVFPPWREAAEKEASYRKYVGRSFFLVPPKPVAVECYFAGCTTAPASYFHILLDRQLLIAQCVPVAVVAFIAFWIFRLRPNGTFPSLKSGTTRLLFSSPVALAVPPAGDFPLASMLLDIPKLILRRDEFWLMQTVMAPVMFGICTLAIYLLVSVAVWASGRTAIGTGGVRQA